MSAPLRVWQPTMQLEPEQALGYARACEELGFAGLSVADHQLYPRELRSPYPFSEDGLPTWAPETPWPEAWCLISAMAAVTSTLRFTTGVYVAPSRTFHAVAHQVATAAVLSADRVALGVGIGWMREEYEAHGQPFRQRGPRLDDMIDGLRAVWRPGWVHHDGPFYRVPPMQLTPSPARPIPIYVGGDSPAARHRAATRGDGWILEGAFDADALRERVGDIHARLRAADRDPEDFMLMAVPRWTPDADGLRRLHDMGVTDTICMPWRDDAWLRAGGSTLQDKVAAMEVFADDVLARLG